VAGAQKVLGPSDDATVLPRGVLRIGVQPTWGRANQRFSNGLNGTSEGTAERLGVDYDVDSLGPSRFEPLRPLSAALQTLTGKSAIGSSLGRLRVDFDASSVTTPISLEYGLTRRILLGVMVPYVKTRNEVSLIPNPGRNEGTIGINPALTMAGARVQNLAVFTQLTEAVTRLQGQLASCTGSTTPECAAINADRARATQLATNGAAVAAAIGTVYGTRAGEGARFAPVEGSTLQNDVLTRLTALATDFAGFLGAPTGRASWVDARPIGAPLMGLADLNTIVSDSAFGIGAGTTSPTSAPVTDRTTSRGGSSPTSWSGAASGRRSWGGTVSSRPTSSSSASPTRPTTRLPRCTGGSSWRATSAITSSPSFHRGPRSPRP